MRTSIVVSLALLTIDRLIRTASVGISDGISLQAGSVSLSFGEKLHYIDFGIDTVVFGSITWLVVLAAMVGISYYLDARRFMLPLGLIVISLLSNNADRLLIGAVSDPLMVTTAAGWIAFNLADIMWRIGMAWFMVELLLSARYVLLPQKDGQGGNQPTLA